MGAAFSLLYPSLIADRRRAASPRPRRGAALGTFTAFFDAGVGLGAPLAGLAAALTDYEGAFLLAAGDRRRLGADDRLAIACTARAGRSPASRRRLALGEEQRLQRRGRSGRCSSESTDSAVPIPFGRGRVDGVDADPLALRHPLEVDGEVDVDEEEAAEVERGADPVADVGGDQGALQRRRLLAGDQRLAHPQPDGRRPRLEEAAGDEAHSIAVW